MKLGVSDHALLRFLERGGALDIEGLRTTLNASLARAHVAARSVSQADYLIKVDGMIYVVRGDTVTTIVDDKNAAGRAWTLAQQ